MSQRPQGSSKAPKSVKPGDQDGYEAVPSSRPHAKTHQPSGSGKSVAAATKTSRMKSEYPGTIYEDDEWEEGRAATHSPNPKSMMPKSVLKAGSQAPQSRLPSMAPAASNRDQSRIASKASLLPTMLNRDQSRALKTALPCMAPTMLNRDQTFVMKSVLKSQRDIKMASRMTSYASLAPQQQKEQDEWQREMAKNTEMCPDGWKWVRRDGGYMCEKGGHGQTDEQIAEGMGSIVAMPKGCRGQWEMRSGPYYRTNDEQWKWNPAKKFPGVGSADKN